MQMWCTPSWCPLCQSLREGMTLSWPRNAQFLLRGEEHLLGPSPRRHLLAPLKWFGVMPYHLRDCTNSNRG